jgi:hypothetical protein
MEKFDYKAPGLSFCPPEPLPETPPHELRYEHVRSH